MKKLAIYIFLLLSIAFYGQQTTESLYATIMEKDSLLFSVGFNQCKVEQFKDLISEDILFYHDQSGITNSKDAFINGIENGLCTMSYKRLEN